MICMPHDAKCLHDPCVIISQAESSPRQCAEYLGKAGRILIRANK